MATYGTNGLTKEHKQAIAELKQLNEIDFFFDGDTAGKEGVERNTEELKELGCKITAVATPEGEDINSMFVTYGKEAVLQLIEERKPVNGEAEPFFSTKKTLTEIKSTINQNSTTSSG